jgi:hypothetical protein
LYHSEADESAITSDAPVKPKDQQSTEPLKDESPVVYGEDSIIEPLEAKASPIQISAEGDTATDDQHIPQGVHHPSVDEDPHDEEAENDHGMCLCNRLCSILTFRKLGLEEDITREITVPHDVTQPDGGSEADEIPVDRSSTEQPTEPAMGETPPIDSVPSSESYDKSATSEAGVGGLANEYPQSTEVQPIQQPLNVLEPPQAVEGVGAGM